MGFSRQEHWSGLPCPPPGDLPHPGIKPRSPTWQADSLPAELPAKPTEPPGFRQTRTASHPSMGWQVRNVYLTFRCRCQVNRWIHETGVKEWGEINLVVASIKMLFQIMKVYHITMRFYSQSKAFSSRDLLSTYWMPSPRNTGHSSSPFNSHRQITNHYSAFWCVQRQWWSQQEQDDSAKALKNE